MSATAPGVADRNIPGTGPAVLSGMTATVTLSSAVAGGDTVTVSYARPAANPLRDIGGNDVVNFAGQPVTNDAGDTVTMSYAAPRSNPL